MRRPIAQALGPRFRLYDHLSGMGYEMLVGPYRCWGLVEVYRFSADRSKLAAYVKKIIGDFAKGSDVSIQLADNDHSVYLVHYQFDTLISAGDKGIFNDNSLQFHIPVLVTLHGEQAEKYVSDSNGEAKLGAGGSVEFEASVPVFSYGAHMINVITSNELRGQGMAHAEIRSTAELSIDDLDEQTRPHKLLDVGALMVPPRSRNAGTTLTRQSMLQLWSRHPDSEPVTATMRRAGRRGNTSPEPLSHIFDLMTLKQFPNDRDPLRACYQSLIHVSRRAYLQARDGRPKRLKPAQADDYIETVWDLEGRLGPADERLQSCSLLINAEHPEADIVKSLGLKTASKVRAPGMDGRETQFFEVKPSAYLKLNSDKHKPAICFEESKGESYCYRTDSLGVNQGWGKC